MNCFTEKQIESALESGDELLTHRFEKHIEECDRCRRHLELFVGSEAEWSSACQVLENISGELEAVQTSVEPQYESTFLYELDKSARTEKSIPAAHPTQPLNTVSERLLNSPKHPENLGSIGRYEIERAIGRGGMGVVFKGFDAELNRPVAIKILSPHLADHGTARQRFTREAKAAAAVVHDNVVPIFDIHSDSDRPYLVMPFVNGVSLQDYVEKNGQIGTKDILRVALQIASGLSAAHAQGLIHRDIKPANILLENGLNRVQITDFGLARAVDDAAMTYSGMIAGTPHYMSPEQSKGESLDHRSDLFSLGCVMYFMATGRTLYRGDGPFSVIAQVSKGNYAPVREINPKVPVFVADIIDKLLETKPQNRFQSATHVGQHLERALAYLHQPTSQKAPHRLWSSKKKKQLSRWILGSLGLTSLLIGSFVLGNSMGWWSSKSTPSENLNSVSSFDELDAELQHIENELLMLEQQIQFPDATFDDFGFSLDRDLSELMIGLEMQDPMIGDPKPGEPNPDEINSDHHLNPFDGFHPNGPDSGNPPANPGGKEIQNFNPDIENPGFSEQFNQAIQNGTRNILSNNQDVNRLPLSSKSISPKSEVNK